MEEGYIKFQCHWQQTAPLSAQEIGPLNHWRDRLFARGLVGAYPDGIGFGNVSCRYTDEQFIISGTATGALPRLDAQHYSLVSDFDLDQNELHCRGPIRASSESMSHAVIYQEIPEVQAVFHIHHLGMWSHFLGRLPTTRPEASYGTPEMAYEIVRLLRSSSLAVREKCFVMGGHREGLIAFGSSLEEAGTNLLGYFEQMPS
ncbi:MAG: class II aldolase/adducin family protein [Bacteroidota bacterium]